MSILCYHHLMKEDAQFFVAQKAFIQKGNEVLVINDPLEGLDFPGGKIQDNELDVIKSLKREVQEETGLEIEVEKPFHTLISIFPESHPKLAGKKVFLVCYRCTYVSGDVVLSEEHDSLKWVSKDNYDEVNDGTSYFELLKEYFK